MTQAELAKKTKLAASDISRWETGQRGVPSRETILTIAEALGLNTEQTNELLISAEYLPILEGSLDLKNPALRSVASMLANPKIPEQEKQMLQVTIKDLLQLWKEYFEMRPIPSNFRVYRELLDEIDEIELKIELLFTRFRYRLRKERGELFERQGKLDLAISDYEKTKEAASRMLAAIGKQISEFESFELGEIQLTLGDLYRDQHDAKAIKYYDKSLEIFESLIAKPLESSDVLKYKLKRALCLKKKAVAFLEIKGDPTEALEILREAHEIFEQLRTDPKVDEEIRKEAYKQICKTLYLLGWAHNVAGNPDEGIELRKKGLEEAVKLGDEYLQTLGLRLLGDDYTQRNWVVEAEEKYNQALEHCVRIEDEERRWRELGKIERGLGTLYRRIGRWEEAEKHFKRSLEIHEKRKNYFQKALTYNELGNLYARRGLWSKAEGSYQEAYNILNEIGNDYYKATALANLCGLYYERGRFKEVEEKAAEIFALAKQHGDSFFKPLARAHAIRASIMIIEKGNKLTEGFEEYRQACENAARVRGFLLDEIENRLTDLLYRLEEADRVEDAYKLCDYLIEKLKDIQMQSEEIQQFLRSLRYKRRRLQF
jgi:tetratricopeptide (TPR) repeat protein